MLHNADPPETAEQQSPRENTVKFLSQELLAAGVHADPAEIDAALLPDRDEGDPARTVLELFFRLLQIHRDDVAYVEDLEQQLRTSAQDYDDLNASTAKLKGRLATTERDLALVKNQLDAANIEVKEALERHATTKEELKACKSNLAHNKTQYQHEIRKRERDHEKLKERMLKTATDRSGKMGTIRCLNPLPAGVGKEAKRKEKNGDEEMYRIVVTTYEEREKEVLAENETLRRSIFEMYTTLQGLVERCRRSADGEEGGGVEDVVGIE
ncbi:Afadin and alpha-actinin-binding-domain-containing protein, partial [Blyttiomyces helicus]